MHGCATNTSCVAVHNPNEIILAGKVTDKETITGRVVIGSPKAVHVTGQLPDGANAAIGTRFLSALVIAGATGDGDPAIGGAAGSQVMTDGHFHSGQTLPANPEVQVGEPCEPKDTVLENGATRYRVRAGATDYYVHSAYPGFAVGECVNVFVSKHGEALQARIASGNSCAKQSKPTP
jgi:hypothetical protein